MKKISLILVVLICMISLAASGCTNSVGISPLPTAVPEAAPTPSVTDEPEDISEFSAVAGVNSISLQGWDNEVDLGFLGAPASEKLRVLDQASDTFAGSHIKNMQYDGIALELFSPKDNGKSFWIKEIVITGNKYLTPRKVGINSTAEELKKAYPELQQVPDGRTDQNNCAYSYKDESGLSNMVFEIKDGKIDNIRVYQEMP